MTTRDPQRATPLAPSKALAEASILPASVVAALKGALAQQKNLPGLAIALDGLGAWEDWRASRDPAREAAVIAAAHELIAVAPHETPEPLSALTLGAQMALLVHTYRLAGDDRILRHARQTADCLARDIFAGGVAAPLGEDGVFFQTVAAYPAGHHLAGMIIALLGLRAVADNTQDETLNALFARGVATLAGVMDEFDAGNGSYADLLRRDRAAPRLHALHMTLLKALGQATGDVAWGAMATRWERAQQTPRARRLARRAVDVPLAQLALTPLVAPRPEPICVPITAFPVMGGVRAVMASVARIMADDWRMEFLTRHVGPDSSQWSITRFGNGLTSPQHFPWVRLYVWAGRRKLARLLRAGRYRTVLAQDGAFTGAFAALAARKTGQHVVCMEHGTVTLPWNATYQRDTLNALQNQPWPRRVIGRLLLPAYWPTVAALGRLAARHTHRYLVAGDETEAVLREKLGVRASQIIRWRFAVDVDRYAPLPETERRAARHALSYADDHILIALICRLSPEKGLDVALEGLRAALDAVAPETRARVRIAIAGAGPLRANLEIQARQIGLAEQARFLGELAPGAVIGLLQACDCFLYASVRGTNISMAVLEAMATGCAIIATDEPVSNNRLLAAGRGIAIPARSAAAISDALGQILRDPVAAQAMGRAARAYILREHSAAALKRALFRATFWSPAQGALEMRSAAHGDA